MPPAAATEHLWKNALDESATVTNDFEAWIIN